MAFRLHADECPKLNAGFAAANFQGIRTCIARKPFIFVVVQGGPDPLSPLWIRTCNFVIFWYKDSDEPAQVCILNTALMAQVCQASLLLC